MDLAITVAGVVVTGVGATTFGAGGTTLTGTASVTGCAAVASST